MYINWTEMYKYVNNKKQSSHAIHSKLLNIFKLEKNTTLNLFWVKRCTKICWTTKAALT